MQYRVVDWTWAYDNAANIPKSEAWPNAWVEPARVARDALVADDRARLELAYGSDLRQRFDLFYPKGNPTGLVVLVHGGFWMALDKSFWSHLAGGPLAHGYAVAIPSYPLAPDVRISDITKSIGQAIGAAADIVPGPIRLIGHSAGGHLVTRMISLTTPLPGELQNRIAGAVSVSGLHDLRPLMNIARNATLKIDMREAKSESPALLEPLPGSRLICWAGARETSEFLRQNALLGNIWRGLGIETDVVEEPDRHHFNVLDGLAEPDHALTRALFSM
ncbi:alpha/beta fold hydrolase [Labrys sp. KNU-23]|uniref:alpha/beta hydrolase n=1 Tax=Labrys sp. KNU-23 TaxID=2789216 RepID=UPI0011EEFCB0|nr:alpha/beta hydrolase [Labrys sp. KNU-23]QEN85158.1 alpha/beta fold hydrolase [Labrys sp. KNU-23]